MHFLLAMACLALAHSIPGTVHVESGETIRVLPVAKTPESNTILLTIAVPGNGVAVAKNPVWVQFRLDGYSLGAGSSFDRAGELAVSAEGQTVHVVVDNQPYFAVNQPAMDPFNEDGYYYNRSYKFELPYPLKEGWHTIRMFPARSFGESLKGENTFSASQFYLGSKQGRPTVDLKAPYLTYNEPSDQIPLKENKPLLLDFYVSNCELTTDGYKVRLTVDDEIKRILSSWQPYYIYGLNKGKHTIHLELIDSSGKRVPGLFNDVQRTIQIQ